MPYGKANSISVSASRFAALKIEDDDEDESLREKNVSKNSSVNKKKSTNNTSKSKSQSKNPTGNQQGSSNNKSKSSQNKVKICKSAIDLNNQFINILIQETPKDTQATSSLNELIHSNHVENAESDVVINIKFK